MVRSVANFIKYRNIDTYILLICLCIAICLSTYVYVYTIIAIATSSNNVYIKAVFYLF